MSEHTLLAYFKELSKSQKPSTMWGIYSMLKATIKINNDIDIYKYNTLIAFLKRQAKGFQSKKSNILTPEQIKKFIDEAPDDTYLATKLATIFGICGACRREELTKINIQDIEDKQSILLIKIPITKNNKPRSFVVTEEFYSVYKKYISLRPKNVQTSRFFLNYQKGKCTHQPIGINKFGRMPAIIAKYLNLSDPDSYTGHTFRRTSATLLADSGADILTLKRHGGWKSNTVAEGYIEDSFNNKKKICNQITSTIVNNNSVNQQTSETSIDKPSTSTMCNNNKENQEINFKTNNSQLNINKLNETLSTCKAKNITININNYANLTIKIPPNNE
ncbi:uncharacterized protein [Temnothorax nylanderi]|uniref:uncharacterized protein n=1 Tax=Temnothorax nylanderi TaxID=102681 RepID=UPI003A853A70